MLGLQAKGESIVSGTLSFKCLDLYCDIVTWVDSAIQDSRGCCRCRRQWLFYICPPCGPDRKKTWGRLISLRQVCERVKRGWCVLIYIFASLKFLQTKYFSCIFPWFSLSEPFLGERRGISHWVQTVTAAGLKRGKTDGIRSESLMSIDRLQHTVRWMRKDPPGLSERVLFFLSGHSLRWTPFFPSGMVTHCAVSLELKC